MPNSHREPFIGPGGCSSGSNKPNGARWIKANETVDVQGQQIAGGLFYLGQSLPRLDGTSNENCLIDPNLAVSQTRIDPFGQDMPYWPSYSTIPPSSRRSYLDWLGGPRADPTSYVGYAFLYFYGLEHRLFLDRACDDADAILVEVTRLLTVYASNRSFQHYGRALFRGYVRKAALLQLAVRKVAPRHRSEARVNHAARGGHYCRRWSSADGVYVAASGTFELELAQTASAARQQDLFEDPKNVIVRGAVGDDNPIVIIRAPQPYRSPAKGGASVPSCHNSIDWNLLTDIRRETQSSASLLDAIFNDERDASPPEGHQTATRVQKDTSGLDERHQAFFCQLSMKPEWTRPDFDELAKRFGLMPAAAKETINEWTYERFDELILCGEDPVHIAHLVVPETELGAVA